MSYLNTFAKKPGALRNSFALKSVPQLKSIYDTYFSKYPREFVELLQKNHDKSLEKVIEILETYTLQNQKVIKFQNVKDNLTLGRITRNQATRYNNLCIRGGIK